MPNNRFNIMTPGQANRGRPLEEMVERTLRHYRREGLAVVEKIPIPWVVRRDNGAITGAFPARKAPVDFLGAWRGRPVAFDTKETGRARFPLSAVPSHQAEFLADWERSGGVAGLLIWMYRLHAIYWLPARFLAEDRKSFSAQDLEERGVKMREKWPLDLIEAWERSKFHAC